MKKKYLFEFILFTSYVLFAMAWVGSATFMKDIMQMAGINSLTQASFLSTSLTFAKIVGTFIAAWTIIKFGIRKASIVALFLMCLSIITPYASNFTILLISRFLMGLGGALIIVYFNPIVYRYFEPSERAVVNGLNAIAFNVGTAIMMFGSGIFIATFGTWQHVLTAISVGSVIMLVIWMVFGKVNLEQPQELNAPVAEKYNVFDGLKDKFTWTFALTYAGLLSFYIVLFTFYPKAGIIQTKQVILFGIIGAVAGMIYSNKFSRRLPIIRVSGLIQIIAAFGLSFAGDNLNLAAISAATLGFFMFFPMPALVTLAQERVGMTAQKISVTFSLFWSISYLVATIVPTIFAKIVDLNGGNFNKAFIFTCLVEGSFFIGSLFLREKR